MADGGSRRPLLARPDADFPISAFARNVLSMLENRRIPAVRHRRGPRKPFYRLRYNSFRAHGLLASEGRRMRRWSTNSTRRPTACVSASSSNNALVSTVRLHHLTAETAPCAHHDGLR